VRQKVRNRGGLSASSANGTHSLRRGVTLLHFKRRAGRDGLERTYKGSGQGRSEGNDDGDDGQGADRTRETLSCRQIRVRGASRPTKIKKTGGGYVNQVDFKINISATVTWLADKRPRKSSSTDIKRESARGDQILWRKNDERHAGDNGFCYKPSRHDQWDT